jgi:hypothetical protein
MLVNSNDPREQDDCNTQLSQIHPPGCDQDRSVWQRLCKLVESLDQGRRDSHTSFFVRPVECERRGLSEEQHSSIIGQVKDFTQTSVAIGDTPAIHVPRRESLSQCSNPLVDLGVEILLEVLIGSGIRAQETSERAPFRERLGKAWTCQLVYWRIW